MHIIYVKRYIGETIFLEIFLLFYYIQNIVKYYLF